MMHDYRIFKQNKKSYKDKNVLPEITWSSDMGSLYHNQRWIRGVEKVRWRNNLV